MSEYYKGKRTRNIYDPASTELEFDIKVIPYEGDDTWVDQAIVDAHTCLVSDTIPPASNDCDYCTYISAVKEVE